MVMLIVTVQWGKDGGMQSADGDGQRTYNNGPGRGNDRGGSSRQRGRWGGGGGRDVVGGGWASADVFSSEQPLTRAE